MKRSTDRILTTHTGSLPRPHDLLDVVEGREQREIRNDPGFQDQVQKAVSGIVRKQTEAGLDIINDGEMSKRSFSRYITERITGFDGELRAMEVSVEADLFPEYYEAVFADYEAEAVSTCNGPITWRGDEFVKSDIAHLKTALQGVAPAEAFMSAVSPGQVGYNFANDYYPTHEKYILAVADAMRHEYRAIVDAGLVLQLDSPDLTLNWCCREYADKSYADYRKLVALHIDVLNHALEGIPQDRVRLHLCWGNSEKPHVRDIPIAEVIDVVFRANVGAISFEGSNPRHAHEWKVFKDHRLPDGKIIIPGAIDTQTNFVEHPELVAERIERYANIVGRENVIAGSDCGFSTRAKSKLRVHPTVTWAKLKSLSEGAKLASDRLWK
jgi:5-methyltetrahydropteroyltriglutamate--homocysteine methyltransferase